MMIHTRPSLLRAAAPALLLLLAACGDDAPPSGLSYPVTEPGPFEIGFRRIEITYTPPADAERTITVAVWYPVDPEVARALPNPEYPLYTIIPSQNAILDAPVADPVYEGGYPVVVHSHGATSFPENSFYVAEAFARHGWVFVAPTHVGDVITSPTAPVPLANRYERPLDISATLDALEALPATDPLSGRVATERVVLSGHSRGSFTVWAALGATFDMDYIRGRCEAGDYDASGGCTEPQIAAYDRSFRDERIVAAIPMAGSGDSYWFGGATGMDHVTTPILMMTGSLDPVGAESLYTNVPSPPMTWVDLEGGCHQVYGFGGCPGVSDDVAQPLIREYVIAFARHHVFGDTDPTVLGLLDGSIVPSPLVTIHTR